MTIDEIRKAAQDDGYFTVEGYRGIGFRFAGAQIVQATYDFVDDAGDYEYTDVDDVETGMVYMVMIGDDYKHVIDPADVTFHAEDICSCGQVGCGWS